MPIYTWQCEGECKKEVEILRPFEESGSEPSPEDPGYPPEECKHKWKKIMQSFRMVRGNSWGPGKGNWGK